MEDYNNLKELNDDFERIMHATLATMDYSIILEITKASQIAAECYQQEADNPKRLLHLVNLTFWKIGICIQKKLDSYVAVDKHFFDTIAANIVKYLGNTQTIASIPDNLKRCYKLVELANLSWFEKVATQYQWSYIARALDGSDSFAELKCFFANIIE